MFWSPLRGISPQGFQLLGLTYRIRNALANAASRQVVMPVVNAFNQRVGFSLPIFTDAESSSISLMSVLLTYSIA